jgi:hypothetical protein
VGYGMGNGMGNGNGNRNELLTIFFVIFMLQILYVPCKRHGDVSIA